MFTFLVFLSAFLLEGIGTYVSVVGLGTLFAYSIVVMIMAVALDIAKVVNVTFLYRHWTNIGWTMRSYMLTATLVLMMITSSGVFGYLSGEFQKAIASNSQQTVQIQSLTEEQARLQKRKEEIDKQIAQLPQNNVSGRRALMKQFDPEVKHLNDRLSEIDKQLPELKVANIDKETHVGPIMYVAKAFSTTPEEAVKWVILLIIFVFDPLAIALLISGNFLLAQKKEPDVEDEVMDQLAKIREASDVETVAPLPEEFGSIPPPWPGGIGVPKPLTGQAAVDAVREAGVTDEDGNLTELFAPVKKKRKYVRKPDGDKLKPGRKLTDNQVQDMVEAMTEATKKESAPREKVVIKRTEKKPAPPKVIVLNDGDKDVIKIEKTPMKSQLEDIRAGAADFTTAEVHSPSHSVARYKND